MTHLAKRQQEYVDGLYDLADFLATHPDFIESYGGLYIGHRVTDPETLKEMVKSARGRWTKQYDDYDFNMSRQFGPHEINLYIPRDEVCEKIQTGTRTIMVPDPDRPLIEKEIPTYEWKCNPSILADNSEVVEATES
jgi:hypothetical protein